MSDKYFDNLEGIFADEFIDEMRAIAPKDIETEEDIRTWFLGFLLGMWIRSCKVNQNDVTININGRKE